MDIYIVIPAHNEEKFIKLTLDSLVKQTLVPKRIVVVDDHSTDNTAEIVSHFAENFAFIELVKITSEGKHLPGSKVINAFYKGFETLDDGYDVICKFDADLIFPENYLEKVAEIFKNNPKCGMAGGFCYIQKNDEWILENLTNKDHIRGALKAYRKECFKDIGGLKPEMGWDTVDELLANYHGWKIITDPSLQVKHLRNTGIIYTRASRYKQGEAFYRIRYGLGLSLIASLKLAALKKKPLLFLDYLKGFYLARNKKLPFLVTPEEGLFIRNLRWKKIKEKLGFTAN